MLLGNNLVGKAARPQKTLLRSVYHTGVLRVNAFLGKLS
jgi:hypothetical protein